MNLCRRKISYVPPEDKKDYSCPSSLWEFSRTLVPSVERHRSEYIHVLNVKLEELIKATQNEYDDFEYMIRTIATQLSKYILTAGHRDLLKSLHRMGLWVVRCRITLILYRTVKPKSESIPDNFGYIDGLDLIISEDPIIRYSVAQLWRALMLLSINFRKIAYDDELKRYLECLNVCCAKFHVIVGQDGALFNHPVFCRKEGHYDEARWYCINDRFVEDTERLFFGMEKALAIRTMIPYVRYHAPKDCAVKICFQWIKETSESHYLEFIERQLYAGIPEWNLITGESERFRKEDPHSEASGYNITARFRPESIDKLTSLFEKHPITQIFDRSTPKEWINSTDPMELPETPSHKHKLVDIDFEHLCYIILGYAYDAFTEAKHALSKHVILYNDLEWPLDQNWKIVARAEPIIVEFFSEWSVYDPALQTAFVCDNMVHAFLLWLIKKCERHKSEIHDNDESEVSYLRMLRSKLFPYFECTSLVQDNGMEIPSHYTKDEIDFRF